MLIYIILSISTVALISWFVFDHIISQPWYTPLTKIPKLPPVKPPKTDEWEVEPEIIIHHFTEGEGQTPVIFIHGGPGHPPSQPYKGGIARLDDCKVYYYHMRGCGKSTRPITKFKETSGRFYKQNADLLYEKLGIEAHLLDLERIRKYIVKDKKNQKVNIIGHSFGAFIAAMYAVEFPNSVNTLVLVSPANILTSGEGLFGKIKEKLNGEEMKNFEQFMKKYLDFSSGLFARTEEEMVDLNNQLSSWVSSNLNWIDKDISSRFDNENNTGGFLTHAMYLGIGKKRNFTTVLNRIKAPTLVLHGKDDVLQTEEESWSYSRNIPNATQKVIDKAKHLCFVENPDQFSQYVNDFFSKHHE